MKILKDLGVISIKEGSRPRGYAIYECPECGIEFRASKSAVKRKSTKRCYSCGRKQSAIKNTTHGDSRTVLYRVWRGMKERCYDKKNKAYSHYGANGISVCDEWLNYDNFKEWMLTKGYKRGLTIEREDIAKGYCPNNCTLIPLKEQPLNKSDTIRNRFNAETILHIISEYTDTEVTIKELAVKYLVGERTMSKIVKGKYL